MDNDKAYKNVKEQIGYCGLWCGSCAVGNGAISQLSKQLKQMVTSYGVKSWGPEDINYDDLITALSTLESKIDCKGCRKGGGNETCKIRECAQVKKGTDCFQCQDRAACEHKEELENMWEGATEAKMLFKTEDADKQRLIKKWEEKLKKSEQGCILFLQNNDSAQ